MNHHAHRSPRRAAQTQNLFNAVAQLRNVQVNLAGAVLNDVEFRRSSRYRLGYGYYYDYGR